MQARINFSRLTLAVSLSFSLISSTSARGAIDRGHRILVEKGLQVQALVAWPPSGLHTPRWQESRFTTPLLAGGMNAGDPPALGGQWGRFNISASDPPVRPNETSYVPNLVNLQFQDEQSLNSTNIAEAAAYLSQWRTSYPNAIGYTNQWGTQESVSTLRSYMQIAQPDMLSFDTYPFNGSLAGGSPRVFYQDLQKYRKLSLEGNDGTGNRPIPYGTYLQTFVVNGHTVSGSEIMLNQFSAWAFGAKVAQAFYYIDGPAFPSSLGLHSVLFDADSDDAPTSAFYQIAETNRQSRNLGSALVRLVSTDVRMKMGQHKVGSFNITNTLPTGVSSWSPSANSYITSINATNLGSKNNGLSGDVIVGYFKPLDASFTNAGHENDTYFMIVNGLSDANGSIAETGQRIELEFDFGMSGINSLLRLSRDTGLVETITLNHLGGSLYSLSLPLSGGEGDLFKFNNGGIFVPEPSSLMMIGIVFMSIIFEFSWRKRSHSV